MGGEVGGGAEQEPRTGGAVLVGQDLGVGEPRVVVDQGVDVVVADLGLPLFSAVGGWSAMRAPAAAVGDLADLLDVHVHQLPGPVPLVAAGGLLEARISCPVNGSQSARWGT